MEKERKKKEVWEEEKSDDKREVMEKKKKLKHKDTVHSFQRACFSFRQSIFSALQSGPEKRNPRCPTPLLCCFCCTLYACPSRCCGQCRQRLFLISQWSLPRTSPRFFQVGLSLLSTTMIPHGSHPFCSCNNCLSPTSVLSLSGMS